MTLEASSPTPTGIWATEKVFRRGTRPRRRCTGEQLHPSVMFLPGGRSFMYWVFLALLALLAGPWESPAALFSSHLIGYFCLLDLNCACAALLSKCFMGSCSDVVGCHHCSLHPGDLFPFTRKPLFIIVDSSNSASFKVDCLHCSSLSEGNWTFGSSHFVLFCAYFTLVLCATRVFLPPPPPLGLGGFDVLQTMVLVLLLN